MKILDKFKKNNVQPKNSDTELSHPSVGQILEDRLNAETDLEHNNTDKMLKDNDTRSEILSDDDGFTVGEDDTPVTEKEERIFTQEFGRRRSVSMSSGVNLPLKSRKEGIVRHASEEGFKLQIPSITLTKANASDNHSMISKSSAFSRNSRRKRKLRISDSANGLALVLSAMYGKMIMVLGMAFPLTEMISIHVPDSYYEAFYIYLYIFSILFIVYVFIFILKKKSTKRLMHGFYFSKGFAMGHAMSIASNINSVEPTTAETGLPKQRFNTSDGHQFGSNFYLRLGAVAFGIGSVIYAMLEFSQLLELYILGICRNFPMTIAPALRCVFIFLQMYFIFLNAKILIQKYAIIARFGLMHVIATNICMWFHVLVTQSKHDMLAFATKKAEAANHHSDVADGNSAHNGSIEHESHDLTRHKRNTLDALLQRDECWSTTEDNVLGELVSNAAPYLYPYTIEYSLICATVLYIMWKNIGRGRRISSFEEDDKSKHRYTMDCSNAHKGLFTGILILTFTLISLILFFVMINKEEFQQTAILEKNVAEILLYVVAVLAVGIAYIQMNDLQYDTKRNIEIENILLIIAQAGLYIWAVFLIIAGYFNLKGEVPLMLILGLLKLVQTTMQTIFIIDASRRRAYNEAHEKHKPGRECVTLLLMANMSMWMMNKFETSGSAAYPTQLEFYGEWAWTIVTHTTTPLAIFYRFHSTVCLCDIWTRAYKIKEL